MEDIEKIENDIDEDEREQSESIADAVNQNKNDPEKEKVADDIAEDAREEGESVADLKQALQQALYENAMLRQRAEKAEKNAEDAHNAFLKGGKEIEKDNRTYNSIVGDLK